MSERYRIMQVSRAGGKLEPAWAERTSLPSGHVRVRVEAAGVCHTDSDFISGHFPGVSFPLTPGHEVAGRIETLGGDVEGFQVGQRVGVGWFGGHCGHCIQCRKGDLLQCVEHMVPSLAYPGGYADAIVVPAAALARIPDELTAVEAAPMGCAGVTTYNALRRSSAFPGDLVAVLGVGGLGHLGVQFAAKMGFETVAIARGGDKEDLARQLGAHHYVDSTAGDPADALNKLGGACVVLATVTSNPAISALIPGLTPRGEVIVVGTDPKPLELDTSLMIPVGRRLIGHPSGTAREAEEAMHFAALTGVRPMIEDVPLADAQAAFDRMMSGTARFRMVLTTGD